MKPTQNFNNYRNQIRQNVQNINKSALLTGLIALANFGMKAMGFFRNLVTVGSTPFSNLNRGQMRRMSWLFAMYRPC